MEVARVRRIQAAPSSGRRHHYHNGKEVRMAKSLLSIKTKKKQRVTRSEAYLVNFKYLGDEPDSKKLKTVSDFAKAYSWYGAMASKDEAREYLKDYLTVNEPSLLKPVARIPDNWIPFTSAWNCRIATNLGKKIDQRSLEMIHEAIKMATPDEPKEKPKADKPSIQDRIRERGYDIIGDIECLYDADMPTDLYSWLQKKEIPAMYTSKIVEYYKPILEEMQLAAAGKVEGYSDYTKKQLAAKVAMLQKIVDDALRYGGNVKKARAPRKTKAPSADKILKNFKYQKDSNEHKLTSVSPQSVLGAQTLWTFNTKYSTLSVFVADGPSGLSIRGTTLVGINTEASKSMKIGRKTAEKLQAVLTGGKIVQKRLIEEMKGEANGRINENTILLKASK